jgi:hypothetical protein
MLRIFFITCLLSLAACQEKIKYLDLSDAQTVELSQIVERHLSPESVVSVKGAPTIFSKTLYPNGLKVPGGDFSFRVGVDGGVRRSIFLEVSEAVSVPGQDVGSPEPTVVVQRTYRVPWRDTAYYNDRQESKTVFHKQGGMIVFISSYSGGSLSIQVYGGIGNFQEMVQMASDQPFAREFTAAISEAADLLVRNQQ